ncbi:uncharacterized protein RJT20DRAFT_57470 [Scheffersomyces xylosifermentans]|uniref:uncharacterized protein n=1 Tax=Scheffersomyces xylosifermentans TaxID=1304137 RepID=UPI00315DA23D
MTLTKYQRGDPINGWNDCPILSSSVNSSSTSLNKVGRKKFQRVGHSFDGNSTPSPTLASTPRFTDSPPIPTSRPGSLPPSRTASISSSVIDTSFTASGEADTSSTESLSKVSPDEAIELLEKVLGFSYSLPERELTHYKAKLTTQIQTVSSAHLQYLNSVLEKLLEISQLNGNAKVESLDAAKKDVVQYMMKHDGVSSWCSPLKKIVSSVV